MSKGPGRADARTAYVVRQLKNRQVSGRQVVNMNNSDHRERISLSLVHGGRQC